MENIGIYLLNFNYSIYFYNKELNLLFVGSKEPKECFTQMTNYLRARARVTLNKLGP